MKKRFSDKNVKDMILWIDSETDLIIDCNKITEVFLERKKIEIVGHRHGIILYPSLKGAYYVKMFKESIQQKGVVDEDVEVITKSGKIKLAHVTAFITSMKGKQVIQGIFRDVTENQNLQHALWEREEQFRTMFEVSGIGIALVAPDGRFLKVNRSLCGIVGYSEEELQGMNFQEITHGDDLSMCVSYVEKMLKGEIPHYHIEKRYIHKDGCVIWISLNSSLVCSITGEPLYSVFQVQDITERKKVEDVIKDSREYAENIVDTIREPLLVLNSSLRIISANRSFYRTFKVLPEESIGQFIYDVGNRQWDIPKLRELLEKILPKSTIFDNFEVEHEFLAIGKRTMMLNARKVYRETDKTEMILLAIEDITERKRMEKLLQESEARFRYSSLHDDLTGLYNRAYFVEEMSRLGKDLSRSVPLSIISIDIDGLKLINDTFGHNAGDDLLISAAKIISTPFREVTMIARVGGDEFCIILPGAPNQVALAKKEAITKLVNAYNDKNPVIQLSMSIGAATSKEVEGENIYEIYQEADENMYEHKAIQPVSSKSKAVEMLLAALAERDFIAQGHVERLLKMAEMMAEKIGLSDDERMNLILLAKVHDLGKLGILDKIVFKPRKLSKEEYEKMKEHVRNGYNIASRSKELFYVANLILHHHEFWDGNGYPDGLRGEQIPIECRIFSIMDAYDVMTNDRPYRKAMSKEDTIAELKRCSGTQFEPRLVEEFVKCV